jgi:hypothetical protein
MMDEDVVDSALLSALRDPRERLALLKLEQVLVDFLEKQPQDQYIDVGGPYNSMVVSPSLGYIGGGGSSSSTSSPSLPSSSSSSALSQQDPYFSTSSSNSSNNMRPQTTFQRCILHRLCDRFRMTREKSNVGDAFGYYIRVCKGSDSTMPPRRLLDLQPWEYNPSSNNNSTSVHDNTNNVGGGAGIHSSFEQMGLNSTPPENLKSSGAPTSGNGNMTNVSKSSSKPRKMKIMKRSSSSNVSANGSDTSNKPSNKNKNRNTLSEKEKKYAEARARIFQQEEGSGDATTAAPNDNADTCSTSATAPTGTMSGSYSQIQSGDVSALNTVVQTLSSSSSSLPAVLSASSLSGNASSSATNDQHQTTTQSRSKATYRNRQQEEADPDFQRGVGMVAVPVVTSPYVAAPIYMGTNGSTAAAVAYNSTPLGSTGRNQPAPLAGRGGYYGGHHQAQQQQYPQYYPMTVPVVVPGTSSTLMSSSSAPAMTYRQGQSYSPSRVARNSSNSSSGLPSSSSQYVYHHVPHTTSAQAAVDLSRRDDFPSLR